MVIFTSPYQSQHLSASLKIILNIYFINTEGAVCRCSSNRCSQKFSNIYSKTTMLRSFFQHRCFPGNFAKFLRTDLFPEHLRCFRQSYCFPCNIWHFSTHITINENFMKNWVCKKVLEGKICLWKINNFMDIRAVSKI